MMRIKFLKTVTLAVTFTTLLLTGCSSSPRVEFYTLNPLTGMQVKANPPVTDQKLSIGVGPVEIPEILDRPQIVTRSGPNKLNIDEFHRWAGRLDESFARVLAENISLLLGADQIVVYPWQADFKPHYRIALDVRYFEGQWDEGVLLDVIWTLTSQKTQTTRKSVFKESLPATTFEALVAAQSRAIAQFSREIVEHIRNLQINGNKE